MFFGLSYYFLNSCDENYNSKDDVPKVYENTEGRLGLYGFAMCTIYEFFNCERKLKVEWRENNMNPFMYLWVVTLVLIGYIISDVLEAGDDDWYDITGFQRY